MHQVAEYVKHLGIIHRQKFGSGDLSLCDGRSQVLNDETLESAIDNNSQTCGDQPVWLHLHRWGKRMSKWTPNTLSERQQATTSDSLFLYWFLVTVAYIYLIECSPVMKSGTCMTFPSVRNVACHHVTLSRTQDHFNTHARSRSVYCRLVDRWVLHYAFLSMTEAITAGMYPQLECVQQAPMPEGASIGYSQGCVLLSWRCLVRVARDLPRQLD